MLFIEYGVIGAVIGSFVNVVSVRGTKGEDLFMVDPIVLIVIIHYMYWIYYLFFLIFFSWEVVAIVNRQFSIRYFIVEIIFSILFCLVAYLKSHWKLLATFFAQSVC